MLTAVVFEDNNLQPEKSTPPIEKTQIQVVELEDYDAHLNPRGYNPWRKAAMTFLVAMVGLSCTAASAIDSAGVPQYSEYFVVSHVVGSLTVGMLPRFGGASSNVGG